MAKRTVTLKKILGPPAAPVAFRIVIEGLSYGDAAHVKERAMEEIDNALMIGPGVTGAQVIYVTTLRGPNNGRITIRETGHPNVTGRSQPRSSAPRRVVEEEPRSRHRGPPPPAGRLTRPQIGAIRGAGVRFGWSQEQVEAEIARRQAGGPPRGAMNYRERKEAGDQYGPDGRMIAPGSFEAQQEQKYMPSPNKGATRSRSRRSPAGWGSVVKVLANGTKVYENGGRITAKGRKLGPETVARLQANAEATRQKKLQHRRETAGSFRAPPGVTEVEPQEAIDLAFPTTPTPVTPTPAEQGRALQRWKRMLGISQQPKRAETAAESMDTMAQALPVERPDMDEEQWNVIITHWLEPDTDPVALCRNYHVTREQLDHELERRGIRPYSVGVYNSVTVAPPRRSS